MSEHSSPRIVLEHFLQALYQTSDYKKVYSFFSDSDRDMNPEDLFVSEMENTFWTKDVEGKILYSILQFDQIEKAVHARVELKYQLAANDATLKSKMIDITLLDEMNNGEWVVMYNWNEDERRKRIWPGP